MARHLSIGGFRANRFWLIVQICLTSQVQVLMALFYSKTDSDHLAHLEGQASYTSEGTAPTVASRDPSWRTFRFPSAQMSLLQAVGDPDPAVRPTKHELGGSASLPTYSYMSDSMVTAIGATYIASSTASVQVVCDLLYSFCDCRMITIRLQPHTSPIPHLAQIPRRAKTEAGTSAHIRVEKASAGAVA